MPVDLDALFDDDYLAFHEASVGEETCDDEATLIASLLQLAPGEHVLDVPCGHGRIARRLAALGASVVGIDRSAAFLARARSDAAACGVTVDYRRQDMHELDVHGAFDAVVCWFTSFGYDPSDARLQDLLRRMHRALRPGGRLLLETLNLVGAVPTGDDGRDVQYLFRDGSIDRLVDNFSYDAVRGRLCARRSIQRGPERRTIEWSLRLFSCPELRDWLLAVGFAEVQAFGGDGRPFTADSNRLICVAHRRDGAR